MRTPDLDRALEWARRGDPEGFRQIYRSLAPTVSRVLFALNPIDAEDLASETWLAVARGLARFEGDASGLGPWILTIARNRHRDLCRQAMRRPQTAPLRPDHDPAGSDLSDPASAVALSASTAEALALVRRLPAAQAEVIVLRVLAGLDVAEVARVTGLRTGTVRVLAHRGLKALSAMLQPDTGRKPVATKESVFGSCNGMGELDALRSS